MVKRPTSDRLCEPLLVSPGLRDAPVLDQMCSHFVLILVRRMGSGFNARRDLQGVLELTGKHLVWPQLVFQRLRAYLKHRCVESGLWRGHEKLGDAQFLARHGDWKGPYEESTLFFFLDDYAQTQPRDMLAVLSATGEWLTQSLKKQSTLVQKNIDELAGLLKLNKAERALLLYGTLARYQRELRSLLVEFKVNNAAEAYAVMGEVAGVRAEDIRDALRAGSRLERIGLVDNLISEHNITDLADLMKVSEKLPPVLMRGYKDRAELMAVFTRPASKSELELRDFEFVADDARMLCELLRRGAGQRESGVNILLYGPPGTGKTELAKVVAQAAGLELFEVEYADRDGNALSGRDRYRSLQIAQVFLKGAASAVLLFDEVEDVFPAITNETAQILARADAGMVAGGGGVGGKAWVNQILESNAVPTLWVTNRIEQIDPAFRRRFAYHLELKSPPPGAREEMVKRVMKGLDVSKEFLNKMAGRGGLTPAQIRTAARFARLVGRQEGMSLRQSTESLIERQLHNADRALGSRDRPERHRSTDTRYDPALMNVESRFDVARIVEALSARGHGSLCFYGPPGSGKTALAEYIAERVGQGLMSRRASDLISKYIGETEQNLAEMFAAAEAENAVLLIDEADSFLQDRRGAERSYEVTEVNEMLQGMERHKGICICTTNLIERIDQAALRRFTFKIRFRPLTPEQRRKMFVQEALDGETGALTPTIMARLDQMDQLCPGDYAAVRRQADILRDRFAPDEFLAQLEAEHRIKPEVRERRGLGFLQ